MENMDCLLIGQYDVNINEIRKGMADGSPHMRDLNLNVIESNGELYSLTQVYNQYCNEKDKILTKNTFSAGIAYLATYLEKNNYSFSYITSLNDEANLIQEYFQKYNIATVCILTTYYVVSDPIIHIINEIRKISDSTKIIIGGPFISSFIRSNPDNLIDYLFCDIIKADFYINSSQGESTLIKLLGALKNSLALDQVENLYYRTENGLCKNQIRQEQNLLSENSVKWSLFENDQKPFVNMRTAISCPFECAFCGFPQHAGKYQTVSIECIEKELNELLTYNKNIKSIYFIDDTFNVPQKRFKDILKMIIKNEYHFKWHSYIRSQFIDEETVDLMKESGCEGAFLGIESGSDDILVKMNKKSDIVRYRKGIELLSKSNITTFGTFITGFPGETFKSVSNTVRFIEDSGLDFFRTQLWFCEHITPIWQKREEYEIDGLGFNWKHSTMNSEIAASFVEKIFLEVKNSIWLPQHDFDFVNVWRLVHNGLDINRVKSIISAYNEVVKGKLLNAPIDNLKQNLISEINCVVNSD